MGAINLKNGNILTLGRELYYPTEKDINEYRLDNDCNSCSNEQIEEWLIEDEYTFCEAEYKIIKEEIEGFLSGDFESLINDLNCIQYNNVYLEPDDYLFLSVVAGYYEGFSVTLDFNKNKYFENYGIKKAVYKQTFLIQEFLCNLIETYFLREGHSWWVSTWNDYETSKKNIKTKMINLRKEILATPCYSRAK